MLQCRVDAAMPARNAMSQRCNGMDETGEHTLKNPRSIILTASARRSETSQGERGYGGQNDCRRRRPVRRLSGTGAANATGQAGGRTGRGLDPALIEWGNLAGRRAVLGSLRLEPASHGGLRFHAE